MNWFTYMLNILWPRLNLIWVIQISILILVSSKIICFDSFSRFELLLLKISLLIWNKNWLVVNLLIAVFRHVLSKDISTTLVHVSLMPHLHLLVTKILVLRLWNIEVVNVLWHLLHHMILLLNIHLLLLVVSHLLLKNLLLVLVLLVLLLLMMLEILLSYGLLRIDLLLLSSLIKIILAKILVICVLIIRNICQIVLLLSVNLMSVYI